MKISQRSKEMAVFILFLGGLFNLSINVTSCYSSRSPLCVLQNPGQRESGVKEPTKRPDLYPMAQG